MVRDVIVKTSKINGKGTFANRNFRKGEIVIKWDMSVILTKVQVKKLPKSERKYVTFFDGKFIQMHSPEKYVNHFCEANTAVKNHCDVAIRNIKKGEEITANYSDALLPSIKMKCTCGSKKCRGIITSNSKKHNKKD